MKYYNSKLLTSCLSLFLVIIMISFVGCGEDSPSKEDWQWGATLEFGSSPKWSPDGNKIIFGESRIGQHGIYLWDLSSAPQKVVDSHHNWDFRFSNNSNFITWSASTSPNDSTSGVWIMNLETREKKQVHPNGSDPSWHSTDEQIILRLDQPDAGLPGIYSIHLESGNTNFISSGYRPLASPMGDLVAFSENEVRGFLHVGPINGNFIRVEQLGAVHWAWASNEPTLALSVQDFTSNNIIGSVWKVAVRNNTLSADTVATFASNPTISQNGSSVVFMRVSNANWAGVWFAEGNKVERVTLDGLNPVIHPTNNAIALNAYGGGIRIIQRK